MTTFKSFFENIKVFVPNPKVVFERPASVADTGGVNPNGIKTPLGNELSKFKTNRFLLMVQEVYLEILLTIPT